jgi:ATP-dependent helicase/nuclease subunit B
MNDFCAYVQPLSRRCLPNRMSELTVIAGSTHALRTRLADRVAELRESDPLEPINILVGASLQRPFVERWLAAHLGGHANVRILMPGDLALLLGAPSLVNDGRRALPPLADRVLLGQVAAAHTGYFEPVRETPGFAEALYRLVRELKGAGYPVADLHGLLDGLTDAPGKASSLAELLTAFEHRRRAFYGPDDALAAAEPWRLSGLGLLVWGTLDLAGALERLLVAIADRMPVDVFFPDITVARDAPLGAVRERLLSADGRLIQLDEPVHENTALVDIRRRLFTIPDGPAITADESLRLVSAPDPAREVRAAARACLSWAQAGRPFWQMAVAYRHGDAYRPLIEAVFLEAGIPVYLHEGSPLAERPLGRRTLALLDLFDSDLSRQSVMDFMTDARFPKPLRDEYGGIPASRWDSVSRQAGVVSGTDQWTSRLAALRDELGAAGAGADWSARRVADIDQLESFITDLETRLRSHPARAPWSEHLDGFQTLLGRYVVGGDQVVESLRGLERFTALDAEVDHDTFLGVVRRAIDTLRSEDVRDGTPGAFARRGVNVVAVSSLIGVAFPCLWMLGATERAFPPPARQDPILLDDERIKLARRARIPLALRGARGTEEQLQFTLACDAAAERLVVSYARRATGESRPRLPSIFFRELASQLEGRRVSAEEAPLLLRSDVERIPGEAIGVPIPGGRYASDAADVERAADAAVSVVERDRTLLLARVSESLATATCERVAPAFARALAAQRARASSHYSEWDGALSGAALDALRHLLPDGRTYSPTALETYAKCPQQFLLSNVLGVRSIEEPERTVRIDSLRRGNLFHRILERFHGEWSGGEPAALDANAETRMRVIAEAECDASADRGETGYPAMWAADRTEVLEDCLRWLSIERDDPDTRALQISACEARFGPPRSGETSDGLSQDEPLEVDLDDRVLRVSGRIDQVTWSGSPATRFRVIDYKTGKIRGEKSAQLQGGRMLQLPLYVMAGAQLLGVDPSLGDAAYAYPTRRGDFKTVKWTSEDMIGRRDDFTGLLTSMLDGIHRGEFLVAPWKDDQACRFCAFKGVCPGGRGGYPEHKTNDGRLARLTTEIRSVP